MMSTKIKMVAAIVCLAIFMTIGKLVLSQSTMAFDENIQSFAFSMRTDFLTIIFKIFTYSGNWQAVAMICIVLLAIKQTRFEVGLPISAAAFASSMIYKAVKLIYARPRPDESLHLINQGGLSFPSGHAMTSLVFYGLLIYLILKYGKEKSAKYALCVFLGILIFTIGISRIYLGVHYPTDVLGGWFLGATVLIITIQTLDLCQKKHSLRKSIKEFHRQS